MPTPPANTGESHLGGESTALVRLRQGRNPFANQVAAVGTADESILAGISDYAEGQLAELIEIVGLYRAGRPTTRVYPVLGDRGSGKTHLLYALRDELRRRAVESGDETLVVVVERLSPGMDAIDYLLWQIVNHLLAQKGDGGRLLAVIAGRLTARLLAESLRAMAPHQRASLIPLNGFWHRLGVGRAAKVQARLDAIDELLHRSDAKSPAPDDLRGACETAGVKPDTAVEVIQHHLQRTESNDVHGWFRRTLYGRLVRVALLSDRSPFEELHVGDFDDAPANVKNVGNLGRRLLDTWLELLPVLGIPVVVVFDQLEDYLRAPDPVQEKLKRHFFTEATAKFINELRNVCILIFAEEGMWTDLLTNTDPFAAQRLTQPYDLPGRPAKASLLMPGNVGPDVLPRLVRQRVRFRFPDIDFTGLPDHFPFGSADLKRFGREPNIRMCLRRMATRFDEIVHTSDGGGKSPEVSPPQTDLRKKLADLWKEKVEAAEQEIGTELVFRTAFIPEMQNAIDGWLQALAAAGQTGAGPWDKVELVTSTQKGQYGYLNVIRTEGADLPGIGIGAWLGQNKGRPHDLSQRVAFFESNPCPIRTLVMLRADGMAALTGESRVVYEKACSAGRDVRVHQYEPRHLHALLAFGPWHQVATEEVQTAKESDPSAEKVFCEFLANRSQELLGWVDTWRIPVLTPGQKGAKV